MKKNQSANVPGHDPRIEQADARTERANTRTQQAEARTQEANTRTERAEIRTEQAENSAQAIRASELSYRRLFEAAKDGILILDVDTGRINDVNPFLVKLLGFSHSEMVGKTVGELSPFKDIESNKILLERLQKDGYVRYEDLPLETRDHRHIAVEFISNLYQAGDKKVIQCDIRDITQRKSVEAAFRQSEARLQTIVENLTEGLAVSDLNGQLLHFNRAALDLHGFTSLDECRRHLTEFADTFELSGMDGKVWPVDQWPLARVLRGEELRNLEVRIRRIQTDWQRVFSYGGTLVHDAGGEPMMAVVTISDITERERAAEEIRQLNAQLEQRVVERTAQLQTANEELGAFSYSVSHDLRAPLRHVSGFVDLLQKEAGSSLSEKSLRYLTTISQAAKRMGHLIDDLLAFSRIRQSEMQKTEFNLDQLVQETLGDFQGETKERNIAWVIQPLPAVWADRALLRLVLVNLMSNAVKFTGTSAEAKIEIGCAPSGHGETVIFVRDNGAGFDPRYVAKLFGVFQRLHSQDEFEGTGIGLANVQRIIHRHGGRAWAEGVVDGGATFYFSIPKQNGDINGH